jgi:hypothetical protein
LSVGADDLESKVKSFVGESVLPALDSVTKYAGKDDGNNSVGGEADSSGDMRLTVYEFSVRTYFVRPIPRLR